MRLARVFLFALPVLLVACSETPRCVLSGMPPAPVVECNPGKVPVCGNDPALLYDEDGALRPVPPESVSVDGRCPAGEDNCRTRPVCAQETMNVVCNDGLGATCVLGAVDELDPPPTPTPDSGPDEEPDAGSGEDAGRDDAGAEADAGSADAAADAS